METYSTMFSSAHHERMAPWPMRERHFSISVGPQGSGLVRTLHAADGLAVLPEGVREIAEGELVDVMLIDDAPAAEPFRTV